MTNPQLQRARLLISQSRHELAEQELRLVLAGDPDNAEAHAFLALCLCERKLYQEATQEAQQAIHLAPEDSFTHYVHAVIFYQRNRYDDAERAIREVLELDPYEPAYFGLLSQVCFAQRRWQDALEAAEQGLELDPDDDRCTNLRAMALVKLGRKEKAGEAIEAALARDPENAVTHANQGWRLLEQGQHAKALEHFRESLRINPELDWARQGIVEALKSRHFVYRIMLGYFLWTMKLGSQAQWGIMIGGYFGFRVLKSIARANPPLAPWIWPILIAYIVFAVMTWIAAPMFNLLLRLNRYGRMALSREQIITSNWVGLCVAGVIVSLIVFFTGWGDWGLPGAVVCGLVIPSLAAIYACDAGWPRRSMVLFALGLLILGVSSLALVWVSPFVGGEQRVALENTSLRLFMLFIFGAIVSQFAVPALASATVRK